MSSWLRNLFDKFLTASGMTSHPSLIPENTDALMMSAIALHHAADLTAAESIFRRILSLSPAHPEATHHLGVLLAQRHDYLLAEPFLRSATVLLGSANPVCFVNLGSTLSAMGRFAEAAEAYRDSIACAPSIEAYFCLGTILLNANQFEEARQNYLRALELRPDFADAYNGLALLENTLDHPQEGIRNGAYRGCHRSLPSGH